MEQMKTVNVAIVGGGPGCKAIMNMILARRLSQLRMKLIGVACTNPNAIGYRYAKEQGIYTTRDYRDLYEIKGLNMIIELTGREEVAKEISRTKPDPVVLMDHVAARLFWDVFQIEEERIAERKRAEDALRESETEKKAILDASLDSIRLVDKDMRIRWVNQTTTANFEVRPEDILHKTCHKVLANRETPCEGCPSEKALKTGQIERAVLCVPDVGGTGQKAYWDCYGVPVKDDSGDTVRLIQVARDVTAQKEAEKELERRHHALEVINSMLFRVTKEYNLNGLGDVLQDIMEDFYPEVDTLVFLLTPHRDGFYFPRPERGQVKETCYDRAKRRITNPELEHALLNLLTTERIRPMCFASKVDCPPIIKDLATGFNSWMGVPIVVEDECYGLFMVGASAADIRMQDDLVFVESLIRQISGVIRYQILKEAREEALRDQLTGPDKFMGIVGRSQAMHEIYQLIQAVADSESTVLITGESGTGKELVARAIHQVGKYKGTPFIAAHCSSFVPTLVQSELFGHEKGAFTGATSRKLGRLERAHGGILFLDEVAELPLETQVLLLRFLQDKSFERVGGQHPVEVNVRIIAATNRRIEEAVKAGRLRKDFYYRLNVIPIHVPSLRKRITDVSLLADHFLRTYCLVEGKEITGFDTKAMQLMMDYDWPGNVRELQNTVARCVVLSNNNLIGVADLPEKMRASPVPSRGYSLPKNERNLIRTAMRECKGNKKEAARLLEISRGTLYSKLKRYDLQA
ncbi:MAG: sigma-54-dependent Fis family transcriptional regulator [Desulfobacterales bacterium]|nr:MAG: sigma-54-dependent Fis family transcriptional regulator [Desulfobacterales bacterium]